MNIENRLRDAFAQRTDTVEVSPGALFEIQRRLARTGRRPELRLRPALVLAAAAAAVTAVVVSVSLTTTAPDPTGEIAATPPVAGVAEPDTVTPLSPGEPESATPPASPDVGPPPDGAADDATSPQESGEIATAATPPPPVAGKDSPASPLPVPDPPPPPETAAVESAIVAEEPGASPCAVEPIGGDGEEAPETWVTVYFACGEADVAPRRRPAAVNDLATALGVLLSGPNEADTTAGFRGLSGDPGRTAASTPDNRWVTIDLPADLAESFGAATAGVTAEQFVAQLSATVFEFPEFVAAEYRLSGDCAAFGDLLGRPCEVHTRDGGRHTSELTAHTIGAVESIIRAEPADGAATLGYLADGARLTDRRSGGGAWVEVITTAGVQGWVSTELLVAQPLALDGDSATTMANLARRLTTGPGIGPSSFLPGGLVLRWGAGSGDVALVPTAGADGTWWDRPLDVPSPRDGSATASLAELVRIDGVSDSAEVRINAPGPLGEPHPDFSSMAYVSIYQASVSTSLLPPELAAAPARPTTTTTEAITTVGEDELPPDLPGLGEDELPPDLPGLGEDTDDAATEEPPAPPEPRRAQVSVIFDFLSPGGPRIAAVEAIWLEP